MGTQPHAIASAHHGKRRKAAACSAATTGISQTDASSIASSSAAGMSRYVGAWPGVLRWRGVRKPSAGLDRQHDDVD